jgi:putative DNA primase/helicase
MTPLSFYDIESIARSLGKPSRNGRGWVCRCPAHDDHAPSFSIRLGEHNNLLIFCHAGCSFQDLLSSLKRKGLVPHGKKASYSKEHHTNLPKKTKETDTLQRSEYARNLWQQASPAQGTLAEKYLFSRIGQYLLSIPPTIKYRASLKHTPTGDFYPCMLSAVTRYPEKKVIAVHRTFLSEEGTAKAPVENPKLLLGDARGGAVRLAPATEELIVCEGIEDGLSLMSLLNKPVWVGSSASLLQTMIIPPLPLARTIYIAQDNDAAGRKAKEVLGNRLYEEGRTVKVLAPPSSHKDFNQIIQDTKMIKSFAEGLINPACERTQDE